VAKINPLKLKADADAAEKKGDYAKAIDVLKQIVQESPRDWNTVNRIGDNYAKLNNAKAANEQYVKVARYFADDGFYLKAIAVWKKVLRNDPSMFEGHKELGDLQAKQGLVAEAKQSFGVVIDEYVKRNKIREAGDVLRRLSEVDPTDMKVRLSLADLYAREGHQEKAAGEYVAVADELVKKGKLAEALQNIERPLRSGPRSPRLLAAAARIHIVQKDYARAIELLEEARRAAPADREVSLRLAEACLGSKRPGDARKVLEGLLERDPSDLEARQQLGQVYLAEGRFDEAFEQLLPAVDKLAERRQIDRAAAVLQQIVQRNPGHIRSLGKLVELYRQSRNDMLVAQTYSQMVEAYLTAGNLDQAASILEMLVQLEPHNEQHRSKLQWLRKQQGGAPPGGFDVDFEKPTVPPVPMAGTPPAAPAPAPGLELSGPLSPDDQEFISEHLAEGRVFRKYGLSDKARDQLEAVLGRFPDNLEALQELVDLHREKGDKEAAAQRLRVMAEVHRLKGDAGKASRLDADADALAPPPPSAAAPPVAPVAARAAPVAPPPPPAPPARHEPEAGVDITVEEPAREPAPEEPLLEEFEDLEAAPPEPEPQPAFDEGELAPAGGEIGGHFLEEEEAAAADAVFDLGEAPAPLPPAGAVPALVAHGAPGGARVGGVPADLRRALDEVESYVSMGFVEDAKGVLDEVGPRFAGHPALVQRLAELGLELGSAPPAGGELEALVPSPAPAAAAEEPLQLGADLFEFTPTTAPPPAEAAPAGGDGFDLASELGGLFGAQPAVAAEAPPAAGTDLGDTSLADIFKEFQKGVDKQLGKEDYETRYNLGIAYKEMGLVDEAIAEFQLAAKDETRLLECASMLGICFVEKGMPKLAVKWFEKGMSAPGRSEDEYKGIRYDLGDALEQADEPEQALASFEEVYGQETTFRDVAQRIERLREKIRQRVARR
jgi:tetratricopeptide (TPR) repeat protein